MRLLKNSVFFILLLLFLVDKSLSCKIKSCINNNCNIVCENNLFIASVRMGSTNNQMSNNNTDGFVKNSW